jgi:hypothetical protein
MATHDYNITNQIGSEFRADLNNALLAIVSNNSNASSPSTTYAYQLWVDTANNVLKLRNSANNAWITTGISITASNSFTGDITGNSATATALATARTINGVSFDGTANISFNTDSVSEGSSNLYFTNERVDDQVNSLLTAGSGISLTYDDSAGTLTIANTNSADITSVVAGDGLTGGGTSGDVTLAVSVDDSSIEINSDTLRVKASGITNAMLGGSIANSKLTNSSVTINSQAISLGGSHTFDSDDIGEGSSNLYFTNARARGSLSIGSEGSASGNGAIAYNSSTGVFTYTPPVISGLTGDTDDLSEGSSNLYYTDARANSAIDARVTNTFINNLSGVVADTATALATARSIALSGDVTASGVNFDGTGDITLSTTIAANSVALGTDTTGNYVATVAGTSNEIEVSGSGSETASITIGLPDDVTIAGNLTVNGTTTTVNSDTLSVTDPLIKLAKANSGADSLDIGFYGLYDTSGSQDLYAGLFRDASDSGKFKLFKDLQTEPTTTVNTSGTGYAVGTLVSNLEGAVTGNAATATALETARAIALSGDVVGTANFDGTAGISISTTIQANSVALGTDTTGDYVSTITAGTGLTSTGATSGEGIAHSLSVDAAQTQITSVGTLSALTVTGEITANGGIALGDSDEATFGDSDELKIYHSSTGTSVIQETGSGNLLLLADELNVLNAANNETKAIFTTDGSVELYHNGSKKIETTSSGVDVTGTLTATTLAGTLSTAAQTNITSVGTLTSFRSTGIDDNADALAITIDSSERVGIGTASPLGKLSIQEGSSGGSANANADGLVIDNTGKTGITILTPNDSEGLIFFADPDDDNIGRITYNHSTNAMGFVTNNSTALTVDSSGNIGIGATSPSTKLDVVESSAATAATFKVGNNAAQVANVVVSNDADTGLNLGVFGSSAGTAGMISASDAFITTSTTELNVGVNNSSGVIKFGVGSTAAEKMRIDGTGVGIGTTSPSEILHVQGDGADILITDAGGGEMAKLGATGSNNGILELKNSSHSSTVFLNTSGDSYLNGGSVGIGNSSPDRKLHITETTGAKIRLERDDTTLASGNTLGIIEFETNDSTDAGVSASFSAVAEDGSGTTGFKFVTGTPTSNSERLRIDGSGNIGIGNSSPDATLDAVGSINVAGQFTSTATSKSNNTYTLMIDSSAHTSNLSAAGAMAVDVNSGRALTIDGSGKLGLGTSSPDDELHISDSSGNAVLQIEASASHFSQISFGDVNDGDVGKIKYDHSDNSLSFTTDTSERLRIDSSGNVGINSSSPSAILEVRATAPTYTNNGTVFWGGTTNNDAHNGIMLSSYGDALGGSIGSNLNYSNGTVSQSNTNRSSGEIQFGNTTTSSVTSDIKFGGYVKGSTTFSERMRIDSSGRLLIGTTSTTPAFGTGNGHAFHVGDASHLSRSGGTVLIVNRGSDNGAIIDCRKNGTSVGSISVTASATAFNTSSDARLKDITGSSRGLDVINNLNPVAYNWKADNHADEGLIAQEVEELVPNAVNQDEDGYYSMDYSKLVTHLVKGMQEQQEQIESLKSEIANLKEK